MRRRRGIGSWRAFAGLLGALALAACVERESPVERATREGILLVGNGPEPEGLDPLFTSSTSALQIQQALFEGLVVPDPQNLAPRPGVAERWEVDGEGRRWRFYLRPDALWSDGRAVTANDFVAGWKRILDPRVGSTYAGLFFPIEGAEAYHRGESADFDRVGVRAISARVLEVELAHATPYFLGMLAHPVFSPVPIDHLRALGDPLERTHPWTRPGQFVGNGPFVLTDWKPHQFVEVTRSGTYWDRPSVRLEGIRFFAVDDLGAEERMFQGGQLHVTEALPPARLRAWQEEAPAMLRIDPYLGTYYILLNHRVAPFDRREVRQALSGAIDRAAITEELLGAGQQPTRVFTPPGVAGYQPPDVPESAPGPDALDGLGPVTYLFNTSESHRKIAEALAAQWKVRLGLEVTLENVEARTYFDRRNEADYELARAVWIGDYVDPMTFLGLWRTGAAGSEWTGWSDTRYDALLAAADRAASPEERFSRLREAEAILLHEQVVIPLYHYVTVYLLRPEVTGWFPTLLDWHPWKHVGLVSDPDDYP